MSRYIDADLLLKTLNKNKVPYNADVNYFIQNAPTADVQEVRHGEWRGYTTSAYIGSEDEYGDPRYADRKFYRCSECRYGSVVKSKFCPNCGAKMDKE